MTIYELAGRGKPELDGFISKFETRGEVAAETHFAQFEMRYEIKELYKWP